MAHFGGSSRYSSNQPDEHDYRYHPNSLPTPTPTPTTLTASPEPSDPLSWLNVMRYVVQNTSPEELSGRLLATLSDENALSVADHNILYRFFRVLAISLPAAERAIRDNSLHHCARCHTFFLERTNTISACVVPCHHNHRHYRFDQLQLQRCGEHTLRKNDVADSRKRQKLPEPQTLCPFVGRHTTIARDVDYRALNIPDCERRHCLRDALAACTLLSLKDGVREG